VKRWAKMSTLFWTILYRSRRRQIGKVSTMVRIKPLEDLRDAFGGDLLSLIVGHDVDADSRQRNREFVGSGNYGHGKTYGLVSRIPLPPLCIQGEVGLLEPHGIHLWQGVSSMAGRRPRMKDKITLLLKQGETSTTIITNKVGCGTDYANVLKREFRRSQKA
jgi:hypothetical protein